MSAATQTLERKQWRQLGLITAAAVGIYAGLRWLPTGTNLSHMDFRVDPKAGNAIEFCDPLNPQFIPVVAARSPVTMSAATTSPATANVPAEATVQLNTTTGKPLVPEDLLVTHTRRLHLLVVDPTLRDYQHVHPEPTKTPGEWAFTFTPRFGGAYRIFGDFTPAATGRGLYASADLEVRAGADHSAAGRRSHDSAIDGARASDSAVSNVSADAGAASSSERAAASVAGERREVTRGGYRFALTTAQRPVKAGQPIDLKFAMARDDGGVVPLEPVMGAYAHLVAFDEARSGFAHLHPVEADVTKAPDAKQPVLNFKLTIPRAGRYVVWAQVNVGGGERFVPFALGVTE